MQPTRTKEPRPLTKEEIIHANNLADVDRMAIESEIKSQVSADKNATDAVLIDKVEMLLVVLEHPNVDDVDKIPIRKKLIELVERM